MLHQFRLHEALVFYIIQMDPVVNFYVYFSIWQELSFSVVMTIRSEISTRGPNSIFFYLYKWDEL